MFWNWIKTVLHRPTYNEPTIKPTNGTTMTTSNSKLPDWVTLWSTCEIDQKRVTEIANVCKKILDHKDKYLAVEAKTRVPWYLVAALHYREASLNFKTCLHNGDPLPGPTYHVPRFRGPFASWESAAIDALEYDGLDHVKLETVVSCLVMAEKFNGMGYRKTSEYSPYVWAGTNHHDETGKYVADGKYSSTAKELQLGVASIFKGLGVVDKVQKLS